MKTKILSKDFVINEVKARKWGKKLEKFIQSEAELKDGNYHLSQESWDNFLVDVGMKKSRGIGDTIAKMTKAVGIKPCGGCNKRRKILNNKFSF